MVGLYSKNAPKAIGPYSQAIKVGEFIFTSGQIALRPNGEMNNGSIKEQAQQVLENLQNILRDNNSNLDCVVKTTIFLINMDDFSLVNEVYSSFFKDHKPARSTVAVKTLPKDALIEIECIAIAKK